MRQEQESERRQESKREGFSHRLKSALEARRKALLERQSAEERLEEEKLKLKDKLAAVRDAWQERVKELKERLQAAEERMFKEKTISEREKAALSAAVRDLQAERDEWRRRLDRSIAEFITGKPVTDDFVRKGYEEKLKACEEELQRTRCIFEREQERARVAFEEELEKARVAIAAERELRKRFGAEAAVLRRELEDLRGKDG